MKTSTATPVPMKPPVQGGSTLWTIPTRSQDPEKLTFLSATLGDHMVLQRAPASAVVWGFTSPGATVTTTMQPSSKALGGGSSGMAAPMQTFTTKAGADGTYSTAVGGGRWGEEGNEGCKGIARARTHTHARTHARTHSTTSEPRPDL